MDSFEGTLFCAVYWRVYGAINTDDMVQKYREDCRFGNYIITVSSTDYNDDCFFHFDNGPAGSIVGTKLHITIDDANDNFEKGCNIVIPKLTSNDISFKVIKNSKKQHLKEEQSGKHFTIYAHMKPDIDWKKIIKEITEELSSNKILSGHLPPLDVSINEYFSIRNDNYNEKYVSSKKFWTEFANNILETYLMLDSQRPNIDNLILNVKSVIVTNLESTSESEQLRNIFNNVSEHYASEYERSIFKELKKYQELVEKHNFNDQIINI